MESLADPHLVNHIHRVKRQVLISLNGMGITGSGLDTWSSRNLLLRSLIFSKQGKEIGFFFFFLSVAAFSKLD